MLLAEAAAPADGAAALLIASARVALAGANAVELREAARRVRDWDTALTLAGRHRVVPFVAGHLRECAADVVPPGAMARLEDERLAAAARALDATRELARIAAAMRDAGIAMLAYKGPALALAAYGDVAARDVLDLDLVVAPRDLRRARATLLGLGYRSRTGMTPIQERVIHGGQGHFPYVEASRALFVELHWRFAARRLPWSPPVADILARATTVEMGGAAVLTPAPEDHELLLLLHGTRHQWERLEWVLSLAALRRRSGAGPVALVERAAALGGARAAMIGLAVARELLGELPGESIARRIASDAVATRSARALAARLRTPGAGLPWRSELEFLGTCLERPVDRLRLVAASALLPTPREWEAVRLPDAMVWAYPLVRVARLAARASNDKDG